MTSSSKYGIYSGLPALRCSMVYPGVRESRRLHFVASLVPAAGRPFNECFEDFTQSAAVRFAWCAFDNQALLS